MNKPVTVTALNASTAEVPWMKHLNISTLIGSAIITGVKEVSKKKSSNKVDPR